MKTFLEEYGLNLLGDTIAGFLSLATFVVVVITYFAQRAMAKQTIAEMKDQNRLSGRIANANYQLALFDKRLKAYHHFVEAKNRLITDESKNPAIVQALENALREAEFVYDESMTKQLLGLANDATTLGLISLRIEHLHERKDKELQWSEADEDRLREAYEDYMITSQAVNKMLGDKELVDAFNKHLMLPQTVVEESDDSKKQ